ncbi:MAG: ATP-dependent sacrificial sulfur transferase LarE [Terrimicrobiaceae bacterium]
MRLPDPMVAAEACDLALPVGTIRRILEDSSPLAIAYSGGVDSSLLLALAGHWLGEHCLGVIADSPSLPRESLEKALGQATRFGATVEVIRTGEFDDPRYASNPVNRCYFCKAELFSRMDAMARERGFRAIAYGENAEDPPADRPGSVAAGEFSVLAPLRLAGMRKADIRRLAAELGLPTASAPAQPCLSSRIPHGVPVTREAVGLIERAEAALRAMGFRILRVRWQPGDQAAALVQVAPDELGMLQKKRDKVVSAVLGAGFASVELDPVGYRGAGLL